MTFLRRALLALSLCTLPFPLAAQHLPGQEQKPERVLWGGFGAAIGTAGIGEGVDLSMREGSRVYRARLNVLFGGRDSDQRRVDITELGVMYGIGGRVPWTGNWMSVTGGLGLVNGAKDSEEFTTIGIPLEIQGISSRAPHLGAAFAANLNPELSYLAVLISIQFGRVP